MKKIINFLLLILILPVAIAIILAGFTGIIIYVIIMGSLFAVSFPIAVLYETISGKAVSVSHHRNRTRREEDDF